MLGPKELGCFFFEKRSQRWVTPKERESFIDNPLVRIHCITVTIRWTGLAPWEFEFPFPGSLRSTFLERELGCFFFEKRSKRWVNPELNLRLKDRLGPVPRVRKKKKKKPQTPTPTPETRNPRPEIRNPKSEARNPKPETQKPKPQTLHPKPGLLRIKLQATPRQREHAEARHPGEQRAAVHVSTPTPSYA